MDQVVEKHDLPVINDLAPHDMSPYAPAVLPSFLSEPIMSQYLCVEIVGLEGRMMYVRFGPFKEEETVVVDQLLSAVQAAEGVAVFPGGQVNELAWKEVETSSIKFEGPCKIRYTDAEMAQFVNRCRSLLESLELSSRSLLVFGEVELQFRRITIWQFLVRMRGFLWLNGPENLSMNQMEGKAINRVLECHTLSTARRVSQFIHI